MGRIDTFRDLGCLVTGASAGIGREIALQLAAQGARLVVTARRADRLEALVVELRAAGAPSAEFVIADLVEPESVATIIAASEAALGHVDVLINNAGFSVPGLFVRTGLVPTLEMIHVNCGVPVALAHGLLRGMLKRNQGGILNVSSVAGHQCAPYQAAYSGTKGFVLNWSNSLHQEVKHTGVSVAALCPGVTDTEFFDVAGYKNLSGFLNRRMPAEKVARTGLEALRKGKMEVVPGLANKALIFSQRFTPRSFNAAVSRWLMGGRPHPD